MRLLGLAEHRVPRLRVPEAGTRRSARRFRPELTTGNRQLTTPMATQTLPTPPPTGALIPALSLWQREIVRFYRNRGRVVGVILSPLLFWLVIGSGFGTSFRGAGAADSHYLEYFFPGALTMIVLFTSIFAMMSVIEDRKEGFLLSVLVAPVHRSVIVLGKVLGGATLAAIQGIVFLVFTPLLRTAHLGLDNVLPVLLTVFLVAFALTALGFSIAWPMDSSQAFHAIVNLFLIPLWLLSGALFPLSGAAGWIRVLMLANPLTYGNEALRQLLFPGTSSVLPVWPSLMVLGGFSALMFLWAFVVANRRTRKPVG